MDTDNGKLPTTIYLYTSHPLVFEVLKGILQPHTESSYVVRDFNAIASRFERDRPSALIIDTCTVSAWLQRISKWRDQGIRTIVLLPSFVNHAEELQLLSLGIHGIIYMSTRLDDLMIPAVESVLNDSLWVNRNVLAEYVRRTNTSFRKHPSSVSHPTIREEQVIGLLRNGFSNKMIADVLSITERTVKFHVSNVLQKYKVDSRRAFLQNFIDGPS